MKKKTPYQITLCREFFFFTLIGFFKAGSEPGGASWPLSFASQNEKESKRVGVPPILAV